MKAKSAAKADIGKKGAQEGAAEGAGRFEALPTLRDALRAAPKKKLAAAMAERLGGGGASGKKKAKAEARCRRAVTAMRAAEAEPSGRWLLAPAIALRGGEPRVGFELVDRGDARLIHWYAEAAGYDGEMPSRSFECVEWAEALGYRVWAEGDFSEADLVDFLADCALELIAFGSWTAKARHAWLERLAAMCNEAEREFGGGAGALETPRSVGAPTVRAGRGAAHPAGAGVKPLKSSKKADAERRRAERLAAAEGAFRLELAERLNDSDILL
mgnify:FL=1